jgi:CspA family cold shock protein
VQGVIRSYDPDTGEGVLVRDADRVDLVLAPDALEGSIFRTLRQGQRVNFDLDADGRATRLRMGSEPDMGLPGDVQV